MLNHNRKSKWLKAILLSLFIVIIAGIPTSTLSASTKTSQKTLLKNTISFCEKLKEAEYTPESWTAFQNELTKSKAVYSKMNNSDVYKAEKVKIEKAKANLMFITVEDKGNPLLFREFSVDQMVDEMGTGFNLGNTMDGNWSMTPYELAWQHVYTTKAFIKKMHDLGFNTIRIPVTYGRAIDDTNDYAIREEFINRIQDIVDYAVSQDMYTIINIHHDGGGAGWLNVGSEDIDSVYNKYEHVWRNIAAKFKDYDEHLIFESMNEVGSSNSMADDNAVINNLNQIFVNVVRSTGSNNSKRWLLVPGRYTSTDAVTSEAAGFTVPTDIVKNRIFISVHNYDYPFGLVTTMATKTYGKNSADGLITTLKSLYTSFSSKGIPVIVGEYGASNKNNDVERAYYYETLTKACSRYGMVPCIWDVGEYNLKADPADYSMTLIDRETQKEVHPLLINAILRGLHYPLKANDSSGIVKAPAIKKITDISLSDTSLTMTIGDSKSITTDISPKNTNDTLLWVSADDTIATVSDGHVRARGIGSTTLTVSSRSGSIQKKVTVTVNARKSLTACTSITTDNTSYSIVKGNCIYIKTGLMPEDTDDYVYYKSSDESVATVSAIGKVVGCNLGKATITITASNGITKTVEVSVTEVKPSTEFSVALKVGFGAYNQEELSKPVTINHNGQYTIAFDCSSDLSKDALDDGITSINDTWGVTLEDYDFMMAKATLSPLVSCDIKYDKILVDGVALTLTDTKTKSGLRGNSGIFETSGPISVWNGSDVKEIAKNGQWLNFTNVKSPKRIEITFTISNLVFK